MQVAARGVCNVCLVGWRVLLIESACFCMSVGGSTDLYSDVLGRRLCGVDGGGLGVIYIVDCIYKAVKMQG